MMNNYSQRDFERIQRLHSRVMDYLVENKRTIEEEIALIEDKKSRLSKSERDYVVILKAYQEYEKNSKEVETTVEAPEVVQEFNPQAVSTPNVATKRKKKKVEEKVVVEEEVTSEKE